MRKKELIKRIEALENRVEVLDFIRKANGKKFIFEIVEFSYDFNTKTRRVSWLNANGNKVASDFIHTNYREPNRLNINGDYIEVMNDGIVEKVYFENDDKLNVMDLGIYFKAFPERAPHK